MVTFPPDLGNLIWNQEHPASCPPDARECVISASGEVLEVNGHALNPAFAKAEARVVGM